ncbi:hypothetical protein LCGC14_2309130, partial [marine sediment metagenome]
MIPDGTPNTIGVLNDVTIDDSTEFHAPVGMSGTCTQASP